MVLVHQWLGSERTQYFASNKCRRKLLKITSTHLVNYKESNLGGTLRPTVIHSIIFFSFLTTLTVTACTDKTSKSTPASSIAKLQFGIRSINVGSRAILHASSIIRPLDQTAVTDFKNQSIASGAPDRLKVTITKISLEGADSSTSALKLFDNSDGKEIDIIGSRVDLGDMFSDYDCIDGNGKTFTLAAGQSCECGFDSEENPLGKVDVTQTDEAGTTTTLEMCPQDDPTYTGTQAGGGSVTSIQGSSGVYKSVKVTFKRKASIQGCVTGDFLNPGSDSGNITGKHTYCSQSAHGLYKNIGGSTNEAFENKAAELMDFDLAMAGSSDTGDTLELTFPINGNLNLEAGKSTALTMVMDTNRLLRFYNQNRTEGPNPGAPTKVSYFFTTVFNSSIYVFAGQPGSIQGYQWVTKACTEIEDANVPTDRDCNSSSAFTVAGWFTVILDSSDVPMAINFMPDDDNTLTVIKGSNHGVDATGSASWDRTLVSSKGSNIYDLSYSLGEGQSGTLFNFDVSATLNNSVSNVSFRGLQKSHGTVTLIRKL
jgi:hypothetical protein